MYIQSEILPLKYNECVDKVIICIKDLLGENSLILDKKELQLKYNLNFNVTAILSRTFEYLCLLRGNKFMCFPLTKIFITNRAANYTVQTTKSNVSFEGLRT